MAHAALTAALLIAGLAAPAAATVLVGRAVLPADTFTPGPTSGQFINGGPGGTFVPTVNGRAVPFVDAQPIQGFSGVAPGPVPGTFTFNIDNGFGAKANSADSQLRIVTLRPDFATGQVTPVDSMSGAPTTFGSTNFYTLLSDPDGRAGFGAVANQANYPNGAGNIPVAPSIQAGKLLTGADFDVEGFARGPAGKLYFGDEFGPFLFRTDTAGRLQATPVPLPNTAGIGANPLVQSNDYPVPAPGSSLPPRGATNLPSSGGFEGFAISPDKSRIYTLLERPVTGDGTGQRRIINVYDTATDAFLPGFFSYRVGDPNGDNNGIDPLGNAIGDLVAINDHEFLVIERDGNQGAASRFKRVYRIDLNIIDAEGFVQKRLVADLLNVLDPNNLGGNGSTGGVFTFPFTTIESIIPIDAQTILVANDNNYPFSTGRTPGVPDDNEIVLIRLDEPLALDPALQLTAVPAPASLALLGFALVALGMMRRRAG
ncbi:MAG: esterase-like activity of phytase family protein [Gemmatimonadaceae bacterium]|nr:esterase-like activity of phytase family protein [Acetobacteraceae bacterium]